MSSPFGSTVPAKIDTVPPAFGPSLSTPPTTFPNLPLSASMMSFQPPLAVIVRGLLFD